MTQTLSAVMAYLGRHYPTPEHLSNARFTKLVYLADWESAKRTGRTLTNTTWVFNHYGPWVLDILDTARRDREHFRVRDARNAFGTDKTVIEALPAADELTMTLNSTDRAILDAVMKRTEPMYFGQFIDFVYDTYPVRHNLRYASLRLSDLAAHSDEPLLPLATPATEDALVRTATRRADELTREQVADIRMSVRDAVTDLLGQEVPAPAWKTIAELIAVPTVESVEARYQDLDVRTAKQTGFLYLEVDVEAEIEGFQHKAAAVGEFHGYPIQVRDPNWNDEYAWVLATLPLRVGVRVEIQGGQVEARVVDATLRISEPS